jgi:hypothetical protein
LISLQALDLWWLSQDMELQHTLSVAALENRPATVAYLASRPRQERFWPAVQSLPLESWQGGDRNVSPLEFRARNAAALREMMPSCMAAEFPAFGLTGSWGALMPLRRHARPLYQAETPDAVRLRWLRLLNARYHLNLQPMNDPGLQLCNDPPPYIFRDEAALPRAFHVPQAQRLTTAEIVATISNGQIGHRRFDPRYSVLLESTESSSLPHSTVIAKFKPTANAVEIRDSRPERVRLLVNAPHESYTVLMDTPYPGWHATIDNTPTEWEPANWVGRAVRVPSGAHEIVFQFEPQSVRLGLYISLLALMGLVAGVVSHSRVPRSVDQPSGKQAPTPHEECSS